MAEQVCDLAELQREPGGPARGFPGAASDGYAIVDLTGAVLDGIEEVYGWCGLCHSFTEFPHRCPGADQPVEDEKSAAV
jgi:hypothetical protein